MKCCVSTNVGTWTNWLTFEPDPDHSPDAGTGLLSPIAYALQRGILLRQENPYWARVAAATRAFESLQRRILLRRENPTYWYWVPIEAATEDEVWNVEDWAVTIWLSVICEQVILDIVRWENIGSMLCISNELGRSETETLWNARTKGNKCWLGRVGGENLTPVGQVRLKPSKRLVSNWEPLAEDGK